MKRVIWKFPITPPATGRALTLDLPAGPVKFLDVQCQDGQPALWALVSEPGGATTKHRFFILATGEMIDDSDHDDLEHVGTFQLVEQKLVFHVFHCARKGWVP